jgi:hypothetical protein
MMKRGILILAVAVFVTWGMSAAPGFAGQDPNDLYGPDSVYFRSRDLLVPCPLEPGQVVVPVYFKNDTPMIKLQVPLTWTGPAELDSASFFGSRINYLYYKQVTIDNLNRKALITARAVFEPPIPEGRGMLVKFYFSTSDTGFLLIDTVANSPTPEEHLLFWREDSVTYTPQFQQGQFHLTCGQDPYDLGIADTVSFYSQFAYYPLSGGPASFYAHMGVASDDSVGSMILPLAWTGPVRFDSITFVEAVFPESIRVVNPQIDSSANRLLVGLVPINDPPIPANQGLFTTLCFTVLEQTGVVQIDSTFMEPINHLLFTTTEPQGYIPQFVAAEIPVVPYWPGDVSSDERRDLSDVIYLLNFIYRDGQAPKHLISADINLPDRIIDLQDVLYLLNYLYRRGPEPLPGDPWWPEKIYEQ